MKESCYNESMIKNFIDRAKSRVEYAWFRIVNGQEPVLVIAFVGVVVAVGLFFGQVIDPNTVWLILGFILPSAATARNHVDPSENPVSWRDRLKDIFSKPDIEVEFPGPVDPNYEGEPDWLEDFQGEIDPIVGDDDEV